MSSERPRLDFLQTQYLPIILEDLNKILASWKTGVTIKTRGAEKRFAVAKEIFQKVLEADPDQRNYRNAQALLRWCINGYIHEDRLFYITEDIKFFSQIKHKPDFKGERDIFRYGSPIELAYTLEPYRNIFMASSYMFKCDELYLDQKGGEGADLIFQNPKYRLIRLKTKEAAKAYTKRMRSCIAYEREKDDFTEDYSNDLLLLQRADGKRWLISFMVGQWRDESDFGENIDLAAEIKAQPDLLMTLLPYYQQGLLEHIHHSVGSVEPLMELGNALSSLISNFSSYHSELIKDVTEGWLQDFLRPAIQYPVWRESISVDDIFNTLAYLHAEPDSNLYDCLVNIIITQENVPSSWCLGLQRWNAYLSQPVYKPLALQ